MPGEHQSGSHQNACCGGAVWECAGFCGDPDLPTCLQGGCAYHQAAMHAPPPQLLEGLCPNERAANYRWEPDSAFVMIPLLVP